MTKSDQIIEGLKKVLKNKGYRLTTQRIEILKVLFDNKEKHLTVEEICALAKVCRPKVSVATVYKTMVQLEKSGMLYRISIYGYCSRYQLIIPEEKNKHRHFVCNRCGKILDIDPKEFAAAERRIENRYNISIESQTLIYYGICKECASSCNSEIENA